MYGKMPNDTTTAVHVAGILDNEVTCNRVYIVYVNAFFIISNVSVSHYAYTSTQLTE